MERIHRTLLDEHLRIQGRKTFYEDLAQMQADLEAFLQTYNETRAHQGRNMNGRTPLQVFNDGKALLPKLLDNATHSAA